MKFTNKVLKLAQKYEMLAENSEEEFEDSELPGPVKPELPEYDPEHPHVISDKVKLFLLLSNKFEEISEMLDNIHLYRDFDNIKPHDEQIQDIKDMVNQIKDDVETKYFEASKK